MATTSLRENGGFQRGSSSLNHIKLWKHIVGIFELAQQRDLDAFGKRIHANVHVLSSNMHCAHLISAMFIPISTWESNRPLDTFFFAACQKQVLQSLSEARPSGRAFLARLKRKSLYLVFATRFRSQNLSMGNSNCCQQSLPFKGPGRHQFLQ